MISRRWVLKGTALLTALTAVPHTATAASRKRIVGANGRINVGFIGAGPMGWGNMWSCKKQPNVHIMSICDVWDDHLLVAMGAFPEARPTKNLFEVLDDKNLDAISIATPDHWHALLTCMAFERGLHVYCEKPMAHSVEEVKTMMRAQEHFSRVWKRPLVSQTGQWQQADEAFMRAIELAQSGQLGDLERVIGFYRGPEPNIGSPPDSDPPPGLGERGWNWWVGPAPWRPFNWTVFQSDPALYPKHEIYGCWRYFPDYGGGMDCDWVPHVGTPGQLGMQGCGHRGPYFITSRASFANINDMRQTPNVWHVEADFFEEKTNRRVPLVFDHCPAPKREIDTQFWYKSGACIRVNRSTFELKDEHGAVMQTLKPDLNRAGPEHWRDFVTHIREGDTHTRASFARMGPTHMVPLAALAMYRAYPCVNRRGEHFCQILWDPERNEMRTRDPRIQRYLEYQYRKPWDRFMPKV